MYMYASIAPLLHIQILPLLGCVRSCETQKLIGHSIYEKGCSVVEILNKLYYNAVTKGKHFVLNSRALFV